MDFAAIFYILRSICALSIAEPLFNTQLSAGYTSTSNSFYQAGHAPNVFPPAQYNFREPESEGGVLFVEKRNCRLKFHNIVKAFS